MAIANEVLYCGAIREVLQNHFKADHSKDAPVTLRAITKKYHL
jgi:hypothetical protein